MQPRELVRVLVVDDDQDDYVILRDILHEAGGACFTADWVPTLDAALQTLGEKRHDIAFVDFRLGGESGLELIRIATQRGVTIPLILLTGQGDRSVDLEAGASGASDYLVKGKIDSELVERSIRYALEHHRDKEILRHAYDELKRTQSQLLQSEKLASIGILAAGLAHEINNPTAFVIGNIELLRDDAARVRDAVQRLQHLVANPEPSAGALRAELTEILADDRVRHFVDDSSELIGDALDGALRIRSIVAGLKGFARQDRGDFRSVDVNEEVNKALELLRNEWKYKFDVERVLGEVPVVNGNASQIEQVLVNILMNAIQAISKPRGRIQIRTFTENSMVCVSIVDDGAGIPEDCLKYIYDPFFTTKDVGAGTGLGLSIAYGIMQSHQGRIDVQSKVGVGTTFTIRFPA